VNYHLIIGDETVQIDVSPSDDGDSARFILNDKTYEVQYQMISDRHLLLVVNGTATEVFVGQDEDGKQIFLRGRIYRVRDQDQVASTRGRRGLEDTPGDVTPPMPAVVVRILVTVGQPVEKGQGLLVVSAMKMETTLVAPSAGRVKQINTTVDAKVVPGDILVEIEEEVSEND
jgi:3-methylcrotonyl-CoA carboxylase alpha subunit